MSAFVQAVKIGFHFPFCVCHEWQMLWHIFANILCSASHRSRTDPNWKRQKRQREKGIDCTRTHSAACNMRHFLEYFLRPENFLVCIWCYEKFLMFYRKLQNSCSLHEAFHIIQFTQFSIELDKIYKFFSRVLNMDALRRLWKATDEECIWKCAKYPVVWMMNDECISVKRFVRLTWLLNVICISNIADWSSTHFRTEVQRSVQKKY